GKGETKLSTPPTNAVDVFPDWSPTGTRIVFVRRFGARGPSDLEVVAPNGGGGARLGRIAGRPLSTPVWSPDGQKVVLSAGTGSASLFLAAAGGGVRKLGKGLDPDWQAL